MARPLSSQLTVKMIGEIKKIQARLGKDLKDITRVLDATISQIPEDQLVEVNEVRADIQKAVNSIKSGDSNVSSEILKKYGNSSR
jgi:hypothetical protein